MQYLINMTFHSQISDRTAERQMTIQEAEGLNFPNDVKHITAYNYVKVYVKPSIIIGPLSCQYLSLNLQDSYHV